MITKITDDVSNWGVFAELFVSCVQEIEGDISDKKAAKIKELGAALEDKAVFVHAFNVSAANFDVKKFHDDEYHSLMYIYIHLYIDRVYYIPCIALRVSHIT